MTTKPCYFCLTPGAKMSAPHWTGTEYVRVDLCQTGDCREQLASAPRRPRRMPQPVILDGGGWGNIVGLNRAMACK